MPRGFVRKGTLTSDTLLKIAKVGGMVLIAGTSPYFLHRLAREFFKDTPEDRRARARKVRELEQRKLINFTHLKGGEMRVELSQRGKKLVRQYDLEAMQIKKPPRWDGMWRIILYDIPTHHRKASDAFRRKLRSLGLFQLQKSVWVSAYECLTELEFLCTIFDISFDDHVYYFHSQEIPCAQEIKKFFSL